MRSGHDLKAQLDVAQKITHIGSWEWNVRTNRVAWSDELYRIYGLEPQSCDITLESFLARVHPDDRESTMTAVRAALRDGGKFAYPERIVRPDGSVRYLETVGETVADELGAIIGLVGTCRDVTETHALDEELRLHADIVRMVQIGLSVWSIGDPGDPNTFRLVAFNPAAEKVAREPLVGVLGRTLREILPYAKNGLFEHALATTARDGGVHEAIIERSKGDKDPTRALSIKAFPLPGGRVGVAAEDITTAMRARALQQAEQHVLERIARGFPLPEVLDALARVVEEHTRPATVSILLLDDDGEHIRHGAAPTLPRGYTRGIDGAAIGPKAGSCGTAAWRKEPVYVTDIETDPLWDDYRELAARFGLRACWSTPILSSDGHVLGTFALYYREPRGPRDEDKRLIARATEIAGIAIQRSRLETRLRDLSAHAERAREEERSGIARELHAELGQGLTALKLDVAWLGRHTDGALAEKLRSMSSLCDQLIGSTQRMSSELRPGLLDSVGLVAALESHAHELSERTGIACTVESTMGEAQTDRETSTALFRIVQEALTNVTRHAKARHVEVRLERVGEALRVEVRDDGIGIARERIEGPRSLGLLGIRERARRLGGTAEITSAAGKGTVLTVTVPFVERPA